MLNFREFGGYLSRFGGRVRPGRIYRGGAPARPDSLTAYDFEVVADLRHPAERAGRDHWPIGGQCTFLGIDLQSDVGAAPHLMLMDGSVLDKPAVDRFYLELYRRLPFDPAYMRLFGQVLQTIAESDSKIFIFCAAGKDRTGMLLAMIGHVLGLASDDIMRDYLMSAEDTSLMALEPLVMDNAAKVGSRFLDPGLARYILGVQPEYLQAMFASLMDNSGGVDAYLSSIGVSAPICNRIRQQFLAA